VISPAARPRQELFSRERLSISQVNRDIDRSRRHPAAAHNHAKGQSLFIGCLGEFLSLSRGERSSLLTVFALKTILNK
jgi:hypothetical protein